MPKKIQNCTMAHLIGVPLPTHGASYTTISHQFVIDYSKQQLIAAGFVIVDEEYRCTADGQIAQGVYKLNYNSDPELSMMLAWTNSYNKQVKFKCLIGAYINKTGSIMTSGELGTWTRKHTGTADTETKDMIDSQVQNANMYYDQLVSDKTSMEGISLNKRRQAQMLGILFAEYQILTTEQASIIRQQMDRPAYVFADSNSLWAFYNYVTLALQHSHPRTWLEDQRILHYFISTVGNFSQIAAPVIAPVVVPVIVDVPEVFVDPNQTNLLDQIADAEADDLPFPIYIESDSEYAERVAQIEEEILETKYTDSVGNTFELPSIPVDAEPVTEDTTDFSLEDSDENLESLSADYEMMEAIESSEGMPAIADLDNVPIEKIPEIKEEIVDTTFDLDFSTNDDTEESEDNIPDFF